MVKYTRFQNGCARTKQTHEECGCDVVISLQILEFPGRLLTVIEHDVRCSHIPQGNVKNVKLKNTRILS
jgi:hypothetical protein